MAWVQRVKLSNDMRRVWIGRNLRVKSRVENFKILKSNSGFCHEWLIKLKQVHIIVNIFLWYLINITKKINFIKMNTMGTNPLYASLDINLWLFFVSNLLWYNKKGQECFVFLKCYYLLFIEFCKNIRTQTPRDMIERI